MSSVYLIQYSVSSTETPGKSFLPLRRKRNGTSVRERIWPRWCKVPSASWPPSIHHLFSSVSPLVLLFISLATPVRFRDIAASETQQPQRHSSLRDTAASETQQPQRHSSLRDTAASETQQPQRHSSLRDTAASETQQPQRHSSLRDSAASETQQPQRHSSLRDTAAATVHLFFQILARSRTPGNKGRGVSISSLLTIAVNSGTYFVPQLGIET